MRAALPMKIPQVLIINFFSDFLFILQLENFLKNDFIDEEGYQSTDSDEYLNEEER